MKNSVIVSWATTALLSWPGFGLFFLGVYLTPYSGMETLSICVLMISLAGQYRLWALGICNFSVILFDDFSFITRDTSQSLFLDHEHGVSTLPLVTIKLLALSILFTLFFLLWRLHKKTHFRWIFTFNLTSLLGLLALFHWPPILGLNFYLVLKASLILFSRFFWTMTFTHLTVSSRNFIGDWLSAMPFWTALSGWHLAPIPRGAGELRHCLCSTPDELRRARLSGIKLLGISWLVAISHALTAQLYAALDGPNFPAIGLRGLLALNLPTLALWGVDLYYGIDYVLRNVRYLLIVVGVVRFCGFMIPPAIFDLFRAKSFGDFIRHFYYYYSETLCYFFVPKTWGWVHRLALPRHWQNGLTVFISILWGGILFHFIGEIQYGLYPSLNYWTSLIKFLPSLFVLALFAGLGTLSQTSKLPGILRIGPVFFYFILFFITRIFLNWYLEGYFILDEYATWRDFVQYLKAHVGLI